MNRKAPHNVEVGAFHNKKLALQARITELEQQLDDAQEALHVVIANEQRRAESLGEGFGLSCLVDVEDLQEHHAPAR